ncbi:MAG: glycosyltransferase [Parcubacteria group bacterium]|jgi:glycosyltransferase involved in cell wall biosynthesis
MKIAIVVFNLSQIGGIATRACSTNNLLKGLGHTCHTFKIFDAKKNFKIKEPKIIGKGKNFKIECGELSIHVDKIKETMRILDGYDYIIFTHPCPHGSENNLWRLLYRTKPKKIVTVSDIYWNDYYREFDDMIPYVDKFIANNGTIRKFLLEKKKIKAEELLQPFYFKDRGLNEDEKENLIVWTNQWRGWKGIKHALEATRLQEYNYEFYGVGREYYNFSKRKDVKEFIRNDFVSNKKGNGCVDIMGFVGYDDIPKILKRAKMSFDLTGLSEKYYGHFNRTTLEGMYFGCVAIVWDTMIKNSKIPKECVIVAERGNIIDLAKKIKYYSEHEKERLAIAKNAYAFINKYIDLKKIEKQYLF